MAARDHFSTFAFLGISWLVTGTSTALAPAEPLQVRIDIGSSCQVIDGFGASDAWQCAFVGKNWPLEKREHIADLLFSRDLDAKGEDGSILHSDEYVTPPQVPSENELARRYHEMLWGDGPSIWQPLRY